MLAGAVLAALASWSQAKTLPGQQPPNETGVVTSTLIAAVNNPKEFKITGEVSFQGKTGLRLSAHERGSASWPVPESLAGKAVEIQFNSTVATGEVEAYLLPPGGGTLGAQTLRVGQTQVRLAAKLPPKDKGQTFVRFDLQPRTQLNLSDLRVFLVERR